MNVTKVLTPARRAAYSVALIRMDEGSTVASIRFAQTAGAADRGEWSPFTPPTPTTKAYCSLDKARAPVLTRLPSGEPTLLRLYPSDWDKLPAFSATLQKAASHTSWPQRATEACAAFLAAPPCVLRGVAWDPQSLRAPAAAPLPPNAAALDERALAVCPLITRTRTLADFERNVAAVVGGNRDPARFNVPYSDLEVDDFAFVLAQPGSQGAFTLRVRGRLSPLVELLSIRALVAPRKVNPPPL